MKTSPTLIERVRAELADEPRVEEKRMFGSTGFLVRGKLCIAARPERLMCRIDPALHAEIVNERGCRAVVMRGRTMKGYVHVDADAVPTRAALRRWFRLTLAQNKVVTRDAELSRRSPS